MKKQATIKIIGIVQGVFYRDYTQEQAKKLGLTGWIKNETDGSVKVVAQGEEDLINELIQWCYDGPPASQVEDIQVKWEPVNEEFNSFEISY